MSRAISEVAQCKKFWMRIIIPKLRNCSGIAPPCSCAETEVAHFRNNLKVHGGRGGGVYLPYTYLSPYLSVILPIPISTSPSP